MSHHTIEPQVKDTRPTTTDVAPVKGLTFEDFGLSSNIQLGLYNQGFERPSPVQEEAIPPALEGRDVIARAKNGTGKTASFVIPLLQNLDMSVHKIQSIVLTPTRELAMQSSKVIKDIGHFMPGLPDTVFMTIGGVPVEDDLLRIKQNPRVVVATPHRLFSFVQSGAVDLSACKYIVLDEADRLVGRDFERAVTGLIRNAHEDRQLLLFSATFPQSVSRFVTRWMREPAQINVMRDSLTLEGVTQYVAYLKEESKKIRLLNLLFKKLQINQCIIFANSVARVKQLCYTIAETLGWSCFYTFAAKDMPLEARNRVFHDFRGGKARILVCTDLITRGIDIRAVNLVVNFDTPRTAETYLHRVGRSGRFGHRGLAITFVASDREKERFFAIQSRLASKHPSSRIQPLPHRPEDIPVSFYDASSIPIAAPLRSLESGEDDTLEGDATAAPAAAPAPVAHVPEHFDEGNKKRSRRGGKRQKRTSGRTNPSAPLN
eukprot:gnl/Dysnectes_brevis/749_a822_4018.p1 GENE.gnl/Dysnectes_brevis/749_a822_4018~~gnl/Dysnectes_brevis/749_a822_4018.p1  ORF type:complete len:521 (+),score=163.48 gnl/Dysnectes_brevis/749_a822_4018:98-1564(+)